VIPPAEDEAHVLVVDDDDRIRELLKRFLSLKGYRVTAASDARVARRFIEAFDFDLLILDVMMPGEDGVSLTRDLRTKSDLPVLLLTARGQPEDRIEGLSAGADDYLPKPFEPEELASRAAAILRRRPKRAERREVSMGACKFDLERCELRKNGQLIRLTDSEGALLRALAVRPDEVVPREELVKLTAAALERSVDVQITRLRRKIEEDPRTPVYLQTVRGSGYRLSPD
jgi:two-component system, OmpR family, phosphate regulon response regulator OmpR